MGLEGFDGLGRARRCGNHALHGLGGGRPRGNQAPRRFVFFDLRRGFGPLARKERGRQVAGRPVRDRLATSSRSSLQADGTRGWIDGDDRAPRRPRRPISSKLSQSISADAATELRSQTKPNASSKTARHGAGRRNGPRSVPCTRDNSARLGSVVRSTPPLRKPRAPSLGRRDT